MELFEFINVFFNKPKVYNELGYGEKVKHVFMLNRFCAIKYPLQASLFNVMNTPPLGVIESWHLVASSHKRTPGWIYTKVKRAPKEKAKAINVDPDIIRKYLEINNISYREFDEAIAFDGEPLIKMLKSMEKAQKVFTKKK